MFEWSVIIANLSATGVAMLLARRGANRRLRLLILTVGLMSFTQTANYIFNTQNLDIWLAGWQQKLVALLSLTALYLLGMEIRDRRNTDVQLRLAEQSFPVFGLAKLAKILKIEHDKELKKAISKSVGQLEEDTTDQAISKNADPHSSSSELIDAISKLQKQV